MSVSSLDTSANADNLLQECQWLSRLIGRRLSDLPMLHSESRKRPAYTSATTGFAILEALPPPELKSEASTYANFVHAHDLDAAERLLLILALVNHVLPEQLALDFGRLDWRREEFADIGGQDGDRFRGFVPSGLTYIYLVAGSSVGDRLAARGLFLHAGALARQEVIALEPHSGGEPSLSGRLTVRERWVEYFLSGYAQPIVPSIKHPHTPNRP